MTWYRGNSLRERHEIEELLGDVARGDRVAFRALYKITAPKLFGVAMRILRDAQKSADALQEAYLQIWRRAAQYDAEKGAVEAWMVGIVRFRAIDIARRERTRTAYMANDDVDGIENLELLESGNNFPETMIALRECLDKIGGDQRRALLEIHLNGFTGEELAARSQVPLGTIKSRVRRGLQNLRICMEQ